MNPAACQQALEGVGSGVAASLRAVDCAATAASQQAFGRLFGHGGALLPALSILLTLYVAFFAFALITGRSRIGIAALTPRMVTLGLVLTFATSWLAYQGVVWNLAVGAPDEIASVLMGTSGSSTQIFADKIDVVFAALVQASGNGAMDSAPATFSPPGLLWLGATLLLLGTVGVIATCKIALAIMLAIGPVFIVMALFGGTRGLFAGWLKGLVLLALTPLLAVLGGSLMLELAVPVLRTLTQTPGTIEPQPAMAFFLIGAVHAALMALVLKVAGTVVSGWTVFGLAAPRPAREAGEAGGGALVGAAIPAAEAWPATGHARGESGRRLNLAAQTAPDNAGSAHVTMLRETRIIGGAAGPSGSSPSPAPRRARGIGSRFRAPPARQREKFT
ncbi:MAG: type IV secretion system protein [Croceibacterium sp.]